MWNRKQLKAQGKAAFKANYWMCVLVALLAVIILGGASGAVTSHAAPAGEAAQNSVNVQMSFGGSAILLLLNIFVINVLKVGVNGFFVRNASGQAALEDVLAGFRTGYGKNVLTMFVMGIKIFLWSLLFIIPGIVKAYSYRLVPYILADMPEVGQKEAMDLSAQLMRGNRKAAFMLDLSFIGWEILNALTIGILGFFYVNPYVEATKAELYLALRPQA